MPGCSQETGKLDCVEPLQRVRKNGLIASPAIPFILHASRRKSESLPSWADSSQYAKTNSRTRFFLLVEGSRNREPTLSERGRKYQHAAMRLIKEGSLEGRRLHLRHAVHKALPLVGLMISQQ